MINSSEKDLLLLHKKRKKNLITEVYRYDRVIGKRFRKTALFPDMRRVWALEHNALKRLEGLPVPTSYGFVKKTGGGGTEIIYAREFIDGQSVKQFFFSDIKPLAKIMARIHNRGVITRDPSPENFIKTPDGKILFIDFGRSVLLNPKNPAMVYYLGKELARIHHHTFRDDDTLYMPFNKTYFRVLEGNAVRHRAIRLFSNLHYRRMSRRIRKL